MRLRTRQLAIAGLLGALVVVLGLTPLGFVPVPTPAGNATTVHIPVILAGVLEGPIVGGVVGLFFGLFSFIRNAMAPTNPVAAVMFADPLVAFVPRIAIGLVAAGVYRLVRRLLGRRTGAGAIAAGTAAALATATNTAGVLGLSVLRGYLPAAAAYTVGAVQGLPECVVAAVLTTLVERGVRRALRWDDTMKPLGRRVTTERKQPPVEQAAATHEEGGTEAKSRAS